MRHEHTPGPWKVKAAEFKGGGIVAYEIIMSRPEIGQANADLISAAPELLAALRNMCTAFQFVDMDEIDSKTFKQALAVIARVEGRTNE